MTLTVTCSRCQHHNTAQAKFCEECAAPLARACGGCGAKISPTAKFCPECGQPTATQPSFASPKTYTPKHLIEKILAARNAMEGERKHVTVLFADLKGSTEMVADRDPEEAQAILDPVLKLMMDAIHYYEGTVSLAMGDGLMAIFGAPVAHEDHAVRACYAALRTQAAVKKHAEEIHRTKGIVIQLRVGLNSGNVVVRSISNDLRMDYTALGETVHLAARMEQMALPGSIFLAPGTTSLAEAYIVTKPLGERPVKGLPEPVNVHELLGSSMVRSRLQASVARGLTTFMGREPELELLRQSLSRAQAGNGQVVALVGEAGMGKSRLFFEFTRSHHTQNCLVVESNSVSYGKVTSYLPLIELIKVYFKIDAADDARRIREKVIGKLLALDRSLEAFLPALMSLLDVPHEDRAWNELDPPQRRQRTLEGIKRILLRESQIQPLIVVFEDLHWVDAESQVFLDGLVESLPTSRILLLVNYRPECQHRWRRKTYFREIRVDSLPLQTMDAFLDTMLGKDAALEPLKRLLFVRTEGNPFFLEESIRELVEMKFLAGERGNYQLIKLADTLRIPHSTRAILTARIDRLASEEKWILQVAAVVGSDVPFALLRAISNTSEEQLRASLSNLQAAEFLYETPMFPDLEYTFRHALTHEVAYESLVRESRRTIHAAIVAASEELYPDRLAERVERLANHALRGELWEKAVGYARQAGAKMLQRSSNSQAATFFGNALDALGRIPVERKTQELAIDLRFDLRSVLMPLGEFGRTLDILREAEALAKELNDQRRVARVAANMTNLYWEMGEQDRSIASGLRALDIADSVDDSSVRDMARRYLGRSYQAVGEFQKAIGLFRQVVGPPGTESGSAASSGSAVLTRIFLMLCLAEVGEFAEALRYGEEALRIAQAIDHPFNLCAVQSALGRVRVHQGDFNNAAPLLEKALEICKTANIPLLFPFAASPLGACYLGLGRVKEALPLLEAAVEQATTMRRMVEHSQWRFWLSRALLADGKLDRAHEVAESALEFARTYKECGLQAWTLRLLGDIYLAQGSSAFAKAERHYQECMALAQELGMRPLQALCHLGFGLLYDRTGRKDEAWHSLSTARALTNAMEMRFWSDRVEIALAALDGTASSNGGD
jgi:class 3 adenylate cyclase/tetratricopeptide (TPR) repeat protein